MQIACNRDAGQVLGTVEVGEGQLADTLRALDGLGYSVTHIYDSNRKKMIYTPRRGLEGAMQPDETYTNLAILTLGALVARVEGELTVSGEELRSFAFTEMRLVQTVSADSVTWRLEAAE